MRLIPIIGGMAAVLLMVACSKEEDDSGLISSIMRESPEKFNHIFDELDEYEVQVIYTQIDRDSNNLPVFTRHYFNVDSSRYFYPASTVKMPMALMALETLNQLGVSKFAPMITDSAFSGQTRVTYDSTSVNNLPSVANYIRKIFLVSDNDAFNRLYELVGQEDILKMLHDKGYDQSRIIHRLSISLTEEENRHSNPIYFIDGQDTLLSLPERVHAGPLPVSGPILKGKGYLGTDGIVEEPMDFGSKNFIPLEELTNMLAAIVFPGSVTGGFDLTDDDYVFVKKAMSQLPRESTYPAYDPAEYFDAYSKFLMYGSDPSVKIPSSVRIFNKIGLAYGYSTDVAYIIDTENKVEFMLSATIHTNENQIYNDGVYEYDEIAFPFMRDLGQAIYNYELTRSRKKDPDLINLMKINYTN